MRNETDKLMEFEALNAFAHQAASNDILLRQLCDAISRLEQTQQQSHEVTQIALTALGERLDRMELLAANAAPSQAVVNANSGALSAFAQSLAQNEQASNQRHEVTQIALTALGERLDRMEVANNGALARAEAPRAELVNIASQHGESVASMRDALARLELAGAQRFEALSTSTAPLLRAVEAIAARLDRLEVIAQDPRAASNIDVGGRFEKLLSAIGGRERTSEQKLSDIMDRVERTQHQTHEVTQVALTSLGERLDRLEVAGLTRDQNTKTVFESLSNNLRHSGLSGIVDPAEHVKLDFDADLAKVSEELFPIARAVTGAIHKINAASNLLPLAKRSPALATFNWESYLHFSEIRVVRACALLRKRGVRGRILDAGSYFGNFSLTLQRAGWQAVALDSYREYEPAFALHRALMQENGVEIIDYADVGFDLTNMPRACVDAVLCMGVIEHVPHTPRLLLAAFDRVLKPGGVLVLDTPNLAYQYQREKLAEGLSVFPPIEIQYETAIPFEGHHREYTPDEVKWMMMRIGYNDVSVETFNYSIYGFSQLSGKNLSHFRAMEADEARRELILAAARKPDASQCQ